MTNYDTYQLHSLGFDVVFVRRGHLRVVLRSTCRYPRLRPVPPSAYAAFHCYDAGVGASVGLNLLLSLAPVTWFATYTALLVTVKWVVLGRCFQGRIPLSSPTYLAWWYTNATLKVWERTGGWWLLDTRVIILVYRLLGAQVRSNVRQVLLRSAVCLPVIYCHILIPELLLVPMLVSILPREGCESHVIALSASTPFLL